MLTATVLAVVVGIGFRVAEFSRNRPLWRDEASLLSNVVGRPVFELGVPLFHEQMAPPIFLVATRAWVRLAGESSYAIRFPSLLCGIAGLFALWGVARRYVSEAAVPVALAFVAVSDVLIYFATEFKQYSNDLLILLGCLWLGAEMGAREWTSRRVAVVGGLGVLATWVSHTAVFGLAAVAAVAALDALLRRDGRRFATAVGLGSLWAVSFAGCFVVSDAMISPESRDFLWRWWWFAFLPLPPRSLDEARTVSWQLVNVFTNPVGLASPLGPLWAALVALALFCAGLAVLVARGWRQALILLIPVGLTLAASALGRYPFHGRVIMFLVPCLVLPVAEGVTLVGRRFGRTALIVLVAFFLIAPTSDLLLFRRTRPFDSHGDPRHDLLDYLEERAKLLGVRPAPAE
ncbi:MAG: glycosyltransferase family 39 protein [Isosphaeraceae bacterium]